MRGDPASSGTMHLSHHDTLLTCGKVESAAPVIVLHPDVDAGFQKHLHTRSNQCRPKSARVPLGLLSP